jgi:probable HAF family extracellular repeat protein
MEDLGTLGGKNSRAYGVSDDGVVVGQSDTFGNTARHACAWFHGKVVDLGTLGGERSFAMAINAAGLIAGGSNLVVGGKQFHACLFVPKKL